MLRPRAPRCLASGPLAQCEGRSNLCGAALRPCVTRPPGGVAAVQMHLGARAPRVEPRGRTSRLAVLAFRDGNQRASYAPSSRAVAEHFSVPIDYYRLLQVPRVSRPDAIRKAYETLVKQPPATAYSADTLFARAVLLKAAAESLTDAELRRSYDAKLAAGHTALRVSHQDLPGTLAVLQEVGEYQMVLDLGSRWLEVNGSQPDAGDVAAAMALAFADRASEKLTTADSSDDSMAVLHACDDLDTALAKLRHYKVAHQLQAQIVGALKSLAPDYACELAALPLGPEQAVRRTKGVALMRSVLQANAAAAAAGAEGSPDGDTLLDSDSEGEEAARVRRMLKRSRDVLTCTEQVSLLPDVVRGSGARGPSTDSLYDGALALVVDGYRNGWPHSVHKADRLLAVLEEQIAAEAEAARQREDLAAAAAARRVHYNGPAAATAPGIYHYATSPGGAAQDRAAGGAEAEAPRAGGADAAHGGSVALERAVCAVLLGDYAGATAMLGLADAGAAAAGRRAPAADPVLRAFVLGNSPAGARDMRPGLRMFAARWLEGVGLASFRDMAGQPVPPLELTWFANPRVNAYVQVRRLCRAEQLLAAVHFMANLVPTVTRLVATTAAAIVAAVLMAVARVQRGGAAADPCVAATPTRIEVSAAAATRRRQMQGAGRGAVAVAAAEPVSAAPAHSEPISAPHDAVPVGAQAASSSVVASPFGHPYGKPLREATSSNADEPGATRQGRFASPAPQSQSPRSVERRQRTTSAAASVEPLATASGDMLGTAAMAASHEDGTQEDEGMANIRRSLHAASAASDRAAGLRSTSSQAGAEVLDAESHHAGFAAATPAPRVVEEASERKGLPLPAESRPVAASEQELRAHLAGLEKAMWDSDMATPKESRKELLMWSVGAVAVVVAFVTTGFRRSGASPDPAALAPAGAVAAMTTNVAHYTPQVAHVRVANP